MRSTPFHSHRSQQGAALLGVIWLIAVLALAAVTTLRVISFDTEIAAAKIHGSRARQVAEMGIAIGSNPVVERTDPILRQFDEAAGEGFEVRILSEGGRFNINAILLQDDKALMREIFGVWGIELEDAQAIADALGDWVDSDNNVSLNGAEEEEYVEAGRINQPFNRPFYDLSEMRLVRGMDLVEAMKPDWRDWFTIWSGGGLDVNEASAELIAAAAECPVEIADVIPERVRGIDGVRDTEDDSLFQDTTTALAEIGIDVNGRPDIARRFSANDQTTRIESIGQASGAKRKITVIVSNRQGKPTLLERTEEIIP